jgi:hypothetical protein
MESAFLDIFLLNGLAELALAEGDVARAATTFEWALRRLQPVGHDDVLASTTIPGSAVAERTGGLVAQAPLSAAAYGIIGESVGEHVLMPSILAGIAKLAVAVAAYERAARLFGASEHLRGSIASLHRQGRWILFEHRYGEMVEQARTALGGNAYAAAFSDGQAMTSDAAIHYAGETVRACN